MVRPVAIVKGERKRMLKLVFIRHGESTGNRDQRMAGHASDRLTSTGQTQCQRLADYWYQHQWPPTYIYTSPLPRAMESLALLSKPWPWSFTYDSRRDAISTAYSSQPASSSLALGLRKSLEHPSGQTDAPPIAVSEALAEFQAGVLTGLTWPEAQEHYPQLCRDLITTPDWVPIPEAETPSQGRARANHFIQGLLANHSNRDRIWVISHHWIMEHLIASLMGCDRTWQIKIHNTAWFEFWLDCDRWSQTGIMRTVSDCWQIKQFHDCRHLTSA